MADSELHLNMLEDTGSTSRNDGNTNTSSIYQMESKEWSTLNKQLHQHGLLSVELLEPSKVSSLSDVICLSADASQALRGSVATLLRDCGRRQELLQELIITNNQLSDQYESLQEFTHELQETNIYLREELHEQTRTSERLEVKNRDLRVLLDSTRDRLKELDEDRLHSSTLSHQSASKESLEHAKQVVAMRCEQLQQQCKSQEEEIHRLQHKLQRIMEEDERRQTRQSEAFSQLKNKARSQSTLDYKLIDIIDSYEQQIHQLRKKAATQRDSSGEDVESHNEEASSNYKDLLKVLEKQIRDLNKKLKTAENDNELLRLELHGRPELKDLREWQQKAQKLERSLKKCQISGKGRLDESQRVSTDISDLNQLPVTHCRKYLKLTCEKLNVHDLKMLSTKLEEPGQHSEVQTKLEKFAKDVLHVVDSSSAPVPTEYQHHQLNHSVHEVWCDRSWHHVLPTLSYWSCQLGSLKELQCSLSKLLAVTIPWRPVPSQKQNPSCTGLIETIDTILYEEQDMNFPQGKKVRSKNSPTPLVALQNMVDHFMNLFDVVQLGGVYTRMNDIYTKLGEVHNVMRTLKSLIGLDENAPSSVVVDAVGRLCETHNTVTSDQLKQLLNVDDLDSVQRRLQEHEEFFPIFQMVMTQLMDILSVSRMEHVIPAAQALKTVAQD